MKIASNNIQNIQYSPQFTARNQEIRFADDIARRVNQNFPRISSSLLDKCSHIALFRFFPRRLHARVSSMRLEIQGKLYYASCLKEALSAITDTIKKSKLGNCSESTLLGEIAARTNGITDCTNVALYQKTQWRKHDLDHVVLLVKNKNKPYIIDPWLGFADYVPNAITRYLSDYAHCFNIKPKKRVKIVFEPYNNQTKEIFEQGYSQEELKDMYPELIVKSNRNQKD